MCKTESALDNRLDCCAHKFLQKKKKRIHNHVIRYVALRTQDRHLQHKENSIKQLDSIIAKIETRVKDAPKPQQQQPKKQKQPAAAPTKPAEPSDIFENANLQVRV